MIKYTCNIDVNLITKKGINNRYQITEMFNNLRIQHSFVLKMYVYNMNMYKRYVIKFIFVRKVQ